METNTVVLDLEIYNELLVKASKYEMMKEKEQEKSKTIIDNLHNGDGLTSRGDTRFYTKVNNHKKELGQANTNGLTKKELKDIACSILKNYNEAFETNYDNCYAEDKLLGEMVYHPAKD